ncbi:MAG TPA: accessory factor UbiK family protein [Dongiaceae bacterium]|nr:accessory factor UbiK family protein [Dongiaceae bacterium]
MQTENRLLDDLARVAAGAVEGLAGLRHEIEDRLRDRVERLLRGMDLVDREEFEAVKAMAARARAEQEALAARLAALEAAAGRREPGARKAPGDPAAESEAAAKA